MFKLGDNQQVNSGLQFIFNPKQKMGVNTVSKLFGHLCKLAGVEGHKTPHMMRAYVATKLANDPRVSSAEVASALRHTSLQSQQAYIVPTLDSEMKRVEALGQMPDVVDTKPAAKKKAKKAKKKHSDNLQYQLPLDDPRSKVIDSGKYMLSDMSNAPMPPNPYVMGHPNPYAPYAMPPPNPYAMAHSNPYAFAAPPPRSIDPAALAACGLTPAQIQAALAATDSSDDEE